MLIRIRLGVSFLLKKKWIMNVCSCNWLIYSSEIWSIFAFGWLQIGSYFYLNCWSAQLFQNVIDSQHLTSLNRNLIISMCKVNLPVLLMHCAIFAFLHLLKCTRITAYFAIRNMALIHLYTCCSLRKYLVCVCG